MTTTIFRKNNSVACIASDSRVTWVEKENGLPIRWFDSSKFLKTITIDGVLYGFAGANPIWKIFLQEYTTLADSEFLLDTLVQVAKNNDVQFFIMRYDDKGLKIFSYSPSKIGDTESPEILRISSDPVIEKDMYAIGSGKYSKEYKKNKHSKHAQLPIHKIISANQRGLKGRAMLELKQKAATSVLTLEESRQVYFACQSKGGDLFTGGDVKMTKSATREIMDEQVAILEGMDQQAKASGAVCASPVDAHLEVKQLESLKQYAVSPHPIEGSEKRTALFDKMQSTLLASI